MAVLLQPFFLQFFDADGLEPVANGFVYTYSAGTAIPKATFTDFTESVQAQNPIPLDAGGRCVIWASGSYKLVLTDANLVPIKTTDNVTTFTVPAASANAFFQSFSGDGSTKTFALSQDLGTDENAVMFFIDAGAGKGYDIQKPSVFTLASGGSPSITFATAPASGTNNIYGFAPSLLLGAASAAAAAAATSAAAAAADAVQTAADRVQTDLDVTAANTAAAAAAASAAAAAGLPIVAAGGTVDAITANYSPDLILTNGLVVGFIAMGANTVTNPTFSPDGGTPHTITQKGGGALVAGSIPGNLSVPLISYNLANTRWELLNPAKVAETDLVFTDITTANSTSSKHGLMPKLSGLATDVFRGDGSFGAVPSASTSAAGIVQLADQAAMEAQTAGRAVTADVMKFHPGVAKVWAFWTSVTTTSLLASLNVSSLTDNGTGDTTVNFSITLSSANYATPASADRAASADCNIIGPLGNGTYSATAVRMFCKTDSGAASDADKQSLSIFGDI